MHKNYIAFRGYFIRAEIGFLEYQTQLHQALKVQEIFSSNRGKFFHKHHNKQLIGLWFHKYFKLHLVLEMKM